MSSRANNLPPRKLESQRITERMERTAQAIDELSERLHNGSGNLKPSDYDALLAQYHSALRRYETDELYLAQLSSKKKLTDEERERTNKKEYKGNYRY